MVQAGADTSLVNAICVSMYSISIQFQFQESFISNERQKKEHKVNLNAIQKAIKQKRD